MANTFGARLIRARVDKGMSQSDLAASSGIAPAQISRYEADKNQPRLLVLRKLAAALDVAPDRLLAGDDEADTEPADAAPTTQCKLRLPVDMHASLSKLAASANRSLNAEIVHRLAQTLCEDFAAEQPEAQPVLAEMACYLRELRDMARAQAEQSRLSAAAAAD